MKTNNVAAIPRVGRINSVASVKREISRIYREVRAGTLPVDEAKKLVDVLGTIAAALSYGAKAKPAGLSSNEVAAA